MSNRATTGTLNVGHLRAGSAIIGGMSLPITAGKVYYVKGGNGSDSNSGRSWAKAFATLQKFADVAEDYDVCYVRGAVSGANYGRIVESVVPDATKASRYVTIIGAGPMDRAVGWKSDAASSPCLTLNYKGWNIRNFYFEAPTGSAGIKAVRTSTLDASDFVVEDCEFYTGAYGIQLAGAPHAWRVRRCKFRGITTSTAGITPGCIVCTDTANSVPLAPQIEDCWFLDSKNGVIVPMKDGLVKHNVFQAVGHSITMTTKLDLRTIGGSADNSAYNMVTKNVMTGTYSEAGGYYESGTGDTWYDNDISSGKTSTLPA